MLNSYPGEGLGAVEDRYTELVSRTTSRRWWLFLKKPVLQPVTSHLMMMLRLPSCDISSDDDVETALAIYVEDDKCSSSLIWHCFENEVKACQRFQRTHLALL